MPVGGFQVFGSGLQLQATTPGKADVGNFNVTGTGIVKYFHTAWPSDGNLRTMALGSWTMNGRTLADWTSGGVAIGEFLTLGSLECIVIGNGASNGNGFLSSCQNGIFIGFNCGWTGGYGGGQGAVCIGQNAQVSAAAVAIGGGAHGNGTNAVAIGQNARATTNGSIVIGINTDNGFTNCINIGCETNANTAVNQIRIGKTQTDVFVGSYRIGQSTGSTRTIADANTVCTASDGTILYGSITAARTVTLTASNSVPAGFILRVADMSGSASAVNTITTGPAGADTIVGAGTPIINTAYQSVRFMSDGVSKWLCCNNY